MSEPGFHVQPEHYPWFRRVLARTAASGLTAFAGDGKATAQYLTKRQGQRHFTGGRIHAATDSIQDACVQLHGIDFVGTDQVLRLNRTRVEAFSGVAKGLFRHLENGQLERYRTEVHAQRKTWPLLGWDSKWDDPVSSSQGPSVRRPGAPRTRPAAHVAAPPGSRPGAVGAPRQREPAAGFRASAPHCGERASPRADTRRSRERGDTYGKTVPASDAASLPPASGGCDHVGVRIEASGLNPRSARIPRSSVSPLCPRPSPAHHRVSSRGLALRPLRRVRRPASMSR